MQGLLSFLHERLAEATPADIAALCKFSHRLLMPRRVDYCMIRLRLPEDKLLQDLTMLLQPSISDLSARQLATVGWAMARANTSSDSPMFSELRKAMYA